MNEGQIKIDNKNRRKDIIIPSASINRNYIARADFDYNKKKQEERYQIIQQLNRVSL